MNNIFIGNPAILKVNPGKIRGFLSPPHRGFSFFDISLDFSINNRGSFYVKPQ